MKQIGDREVSASGQIFGTEDSVVHLSTERCTRKDNILHPHAECKTRMIGSQLRDMLARG